MPESAKGLILIHTGDGKGKSTSAFGAAMRFIGQGFNVGMVQFMKGQWKTGEAEAANIFGEQFEIFSFGEGFSWEVKDPERNRQAVEQAWAKCLEMLRDDHYQMVIFDEINIALQMNLLSSGEVMDALKKKPPAKHVILTGRGAPSELIEIADLVTEMKCVKHPFDQGTPAQRGIEY